MKPRSKYQQHIAELSAKLPPITPKQKQWAFDHCFETGGYLCKGNVWCLHCGEVFQHNSSELGTQLVGDEAVCPNCGRTLKLEVSRKKKFNERWYYTILTTFRGFQVCRHFIAEKHMTMGNIEPYYRINEAVQHWIDEKGKETIVARPCKCMPHVYDAWDFRKPMTIKSRRSNPYSYNPDKYTIDACYIYPNRSILPILKRNGYTGRFHGIPAVELFQLLLTDKKAEMFIKTGQFDILRHHYKRGIPNSIMHAVRIANRNRYIIKDASMWIDYLNLLEYFHRDTHNAHYVCPANLKLEHDKLLSRKLRLERQMEAEKKRKQSAKWEADYRESKGRFFGICFGNKDIIITVIQSVAEMAAEGEAMHHCVYAAEYFKKANSLILSARDKNGNRIETIELDLKTFQVIQSRGVCNKNTQRHAEIINLVNANMAKFRNAG